MKEKVLKRAFELLKNKTLLKILKASSYEQLQGVFIDDENIVVTNDFFLYVEPHHTTFSEAVFVNLKKEIKTNIDYPKYKLVMTQPSQYSTCVKLDSKKLKNVLKDLKDDNVIKIEKDLQVAKIYKNHRPATIETILSEPVKLSDQAVCLNEPVFLKVSYLKLLTDLFNDSFDFYNSKSKEIVLFKQQDRYFYLGTMIMDN